MRLLVSLAVAASLALPASAAAATTFLFSGHGWGHGVGMSQYGAYGQARAGRSYARILAYYYRGTKLAQAPRRTVRVLVREDASSLLVGSDSPFVVTDASGWRRRFPAGTVRVRARPRLTIAGRKRALAPPLRVDPTASPLRFGAQTYHGAFAISVKRKRLEGVNVVGLEDYLLGVVAREMPPEWPLAALKAQAVAARTYALATAGGGAFDLHADTRSQVYGGIPAEDPRTAAAVRATARRVVLWDGRPALAVFHSSSGGRTAAVEEAWAGADPIPYLRSVADPWDSLSPYHDWGPTGFSARAVRQRLQISTGSLAALAVERNGSGRVALLRARGSRGEATLAGSTVEARLELRYTWFAVRTLSLGALERNGRRVRVEGVATGRGPFTLERRIGDGPWKQLRLPPRSAAGAFRLTVAVRAVTMLRLAYGPGGAALLRLRPR